MLETQEKEIEGRLYTYQPLMLKPARALFDKLVKKFGPAIASAIEGLESAPIEGSGDVLEALSGASKSVAGLIDGLVKGLDAKTHEEIADTVAQNMRVELTNDDGDTQTVALKQARDMIFGQNLLTEFKVIAFALDVQFSDFLAPMRQAATMAIAVRAKGASLSNSQKGSTGSFSESPQVRNSATA